MRYFSVEESVRLNGERHLANAIGYAAKGNPNYCMGSLRKAERNFKRADSLTLPPFLKPVVDILQGIVADQIMHGS